MTLRALVPPSWSQALHQALESPSFAALERFLVEERARCTVFPPDEDVFSALELTSLPQVKAVILGQDPYHDDGQAHGLAFSVRPPVRPPPSLQNIFKELKSDLGIDPPAHGFLLHWAREGVLLLNAVLTVRAHEAASHRGRGWESFTDAIIRAVGHKDDHVVFMLWGAHAQKKRALVDEKRHTVLESAHPSPLSARAGFFGSRPFSRCNDALVRAGKRPVDWRIPPLA